MTKRIGVLSGGGDCGGINAAIEAVVKSAHKEGWEVYGIKRGWEGLILAHIYPLSISDVEGIHSQTGTFLQTSRINLFKYTGILNGQRLEKADVSKLVIENAKRAGLEDIICIGGDDTLGVIIKEKDGKLCGLVTDYEDAPTFIGIPKTMDGDLQVYSLGLDTAINMAMQELKNFIPILEANGSIGFVEIFGRDVGRVTFKAGIAAGADVILIPEILIDLDYMCDFIANKYNERAERNNGTSYVLVAVAEGVHNPVTGQQVYLDIGEDSFGHGKLGGVGDKIAKLVQEQLKDDSRITKYGKVDVKTKRPTYGVRGGPTLSTDSYIGQKLGAAAIQYLKMNGKSGMAIVNFTEDGEIETMPIEELIKPRPVDSKVLELFERNGLCYFGRKPYSQTYRPTVIVRK